MPQTKPKVAKSLPISDEEVELIRLAYPLKVAPEHARKMIRRQHGRLVAGSVTTAAGVKLAKMTSADATAYLLGRTQLYATSSQGMGEYVPHPGTWFNGGNYTEDESTWDKRGALPIRQIPPTKFSDPEAMNAR
jgi:hypothetical protein